MRKQRENANKLARMLDSQLKGQGNTESYVNGEEQVEKFRRQKAVPKKVKLVSYSHNPDISYPKVGDTLAVCHRSNEGREQRTGVENRTVKAVYLSDAQGFCVKDNVGDVWHVRPASVGGQKWETFVRGEKQKVLAGTRESKDSHKLALSERSEKVLTK